MEGSFLLIESECVLPLQMSLTRAVLLRSAWPGGGVRAVTAAVWSVKRRSASSFAKYNWEDPLHLEGSLTEEEREIRDMARGYCQEKLMPRVVEAHRHECEWGSVKGRQRQG